jgi:hypothetical protein
MKNLCLYSSNFTIGAASALITMEKFEFEELDEDTRSFMLEELEHDARSDAIYFSARFSEAGKSACYDCLREAIQNGNEQTLAAALSRPDFWKPFEVHHRGTKSYPVKIAPINVARIYAQGEFNVYYLRGLCRRLLAEGETHAEVYRAKKVAVPRTGQTVDPGDLLPLQDVLEDLRSRDEGVSRLGLPRGVLSGLSLRRLRK